MGTRRSARARHLGAAVLLMTVATASCSGGGDEDESGAAVGGAVAEGAPEDGGTTVAGGDEDGGESDPTADDAGEGAGPSSVTLDETVRFGGFTFTVAGAELAPAGAGMSTVTVDATVENPSGANGWPDASLVHLEKGGVTVGTVDEFSAPQVPAGATSAWEILVADVPDDTALDEVELVFGGEDLHQARVPFGDTGETVTLEPVEVTFGEPGRGEGSEVELAVTGGRVMYGDPEDLNTLAADTVLLVLDLQATTTANSPVQSVAVISTDLRVTLPDGTSVGPYPGAITRFGGALYQSQSTTGFAGFEIPADTSGDVQVVLRGGYGPAGTANVDVESAVTVTLPTG